MSFDALEQHRAERAGRHHEPELLVVVGDGDNDAGMIEFAASMKKGGIEGFGVAMGNASERSRKAASVILDETNADDGAAVAIERFIL